MSDLTTETALREMSRTIGGLESTVKTLVSTWQSQEATATLGRRDLHQKFDTLAIKVTELTGKLETTIADIADIKPSVEAFENAKAQAQGAQKLGKWMWGVLTVCGGLVGWVLAHWISIEPKPPLH